MRRVPRMVVMFALAALVPTMSVAQPRKTHGSHHAAHSAGNHVAHRTKAVHKTNTELGQHSVHEDSTFYEGTPFQNPAPISPEVLRVLAKSDAAKEILDSAAESGKVDTAQLFRARQIQLSGGKDEDLVVLGTPPKQGLDPNWFWVVRSANRAPQVVLHAGSGSLKLLESRTNGYRDILMVTPLASRTRCVTYHFDGNRYDVWQEKWADSVGPQGLGCEGR